MSGLPSPVLLTGATGFIGRHLQRHLLDLGAAVRVLARPRARPESYLDGRCEVRTGALDNPRIVADAVDGVAAVVYGAGTVRGRDYRDFAAANVTGVATLVRVLDDLPAPPPVVLVSSLAASRPELSHYAASKRAGEQCLEAATGLTWTILRPPAVYGPGDTEMLPLLALARRGLALRPGPPGQRLALLHVADLTRAVAAALSHADACRGCTFELHDGKPEGYDFAEIGLAVAGRRVREVGVPGALLRGIGAVNAVAAGILGYAPMLTPGKVRELQQPGWLCDNRAFARATGWRPEIALDQGAAALFR